MNQTSRSVGATIAVVLLGVTAAGAAGFGLIAPVIALGAADLLGGALGSSAQAAMVVVGILSLLVAAAAAVGARMVHTGRPAGAVIGFVVGAILVAAPAAAAASGGWHPALAASVALAAGVIGSLAVAFPWGFVARRGSVSAPLRGAPPIRRHARARRAPARGSS